MEKKIKIFFFLSNFSHGGAANSIVRLCKSLNKNFFEVSVICLGKCDYKEQLLKSKITVNELRFKRTFLAFKKILKIISLKGNQKIILVSNINYTNVLSSFFIKFFYNLKIKLILVERTPLQELDIYFGLVDCLKKQLIKIGIQFFYKYSNLVICNSKKISKDIKLLSNANTKTVYPPSYFKIKKFNKNKVSQNKKFKIILSIGRLSKEKNYNLLINAFKKIDINNAKLQILGDGPEKNRLIKMVNILDLKDKVSFEGQQSNIEKYFKKADLYVNCSRFEGFPNSVVESINYQVPVICSDSHGGIREIISSNYKNQIFKNNSHADLTKKINYFFLNTKKFTKNNIKLKKNVNKFSLEKNRNLYEQIFFKI
jgi:glycosyltransferase involved in cell wall biosynthesis